MSRHVAGRPVRKVRKPAQHLTTHHQPKGTGRGIQKALHGVQGKEKTGASGAQVKAGNVFRQPQVPLQQASCGRDQRLRRHCGHNAGSHLLRPDSGSLQGPLGRLTAQLGVGLALAVMPGANTGTAGDPLVICVYNLA